MRFVIFLINEYWIGLEVLHGLFKEPITGPLKSKMAEIWYAILDLDAKMQKCDFLKNEAI